MNEIQKKEYTEAEKRKIFRNCKIGIGSVVIGVLVLLVLPFCGTWFRNHVPFLVIFSLVCMVFGLWMIGPVLHDITTLEYEQKYEKEKKRSLRCSTGYSRQRIVTNLLNHGFTLGSSELYESVQRSGNVGKVMYQAMIVEAEDLLQTYDRIEQQLCEHQFLEEKYCVFVILCKKNVSETDKVWLQETAAEIMCLDGILPTTSESTVLVPIPVVLDMERNTVMYFPCEKGFQMYRLGCKKLEEILS